MAKDTGTVDPEASDVDDLNATARDPPADQLLPLEATLTERSERVTGRTLGDHAAAPMDTVRVKDHAVAPTEDSRVRDHVAALMAGSRVVKKDGNPTVHLHLIETTTSLVSKQAADEEGAVGDMVQEATVSSTSNGTIIPSIWVHYALL